MGCACKPQTVGVIVYPSDYFYPCEGEKTPPWECRCSDFVIDDKGNIQIFDFDLVFAVVADGHWSRVARKLEDRDCNCGEKAEKKGSLFGRLDEDLLQKFLDAVGKQEG